jgi:hypothetical protein
MALQDALGTVGDPVSRALRSTFGKPSEEATTFTPEQGMQRRIARGTVAEEQLPGLLEGSMSEATKAQEDIAEQRTGMAKRGKAIGEEFAVKERELIESPEYKQKEIPAFEPSQSNLEDIRNVLGLSIVAGFLAGGASKRSGMAAMAALNGAVEGFRQGRQDVYKREIDVFVKNVEAIKENNKQTLERFNRAMGLLQTDRKAAEGELKVLEAEVQNSVAAAALRQGQYKQAQDALFKAVEGSDRASQTMLQLKQQAELRREQMAAQERARQEQMAFQQQMAADRMAFQREILQAKQEGRIQSIPGPVEKRLENLGSVKDSLGRISSTGKPEFFGIFPQKNLADTFLTLVDRGLPIKGVSNDTVNWWKDYREFIAKVRNTLFGQTLTRAEESSFDAFTINPTTSPENAKMYFDRQVDIVNKAAERQRKIGSSLGINNQTLNAYLGEPVGGIESPKPAQPGSSDIQSERARANEAIRNGAPRDAVARRFKENTGQEL